VRVRAQLLIAFDASAVTGAVVGRGFGPPRVSVFSMAALSPGALVVSPFEANVARPDEVRDALARVGRELGAARTPVTLILPSGLARILLLETPADIPPHQYARYRLAPGLMFPPEEAVIDVLPLGGPRVLVAGVRRTVVQGYEAVAQAAGLEQDRLELAPLAALAALLKDPAGMAPTVDVILGDVAVSFAAREGGVVRAFRTRLRDPGPWESRRLEEDADRTSLLVGAGDPPRLRAVGSGAGDILRSWAAGGRTVEPGWHAEGRIPVPAAELAWFGSALA